MSYDLMQRMKHAVLAMAIVTGVGCVGTEPDGIEQEPPVGEAQQELARCSFTKVWRWDEITYGPPCTYKGCTAYTIHHEVMCWNLCSSANTIICEDENGNPTSQPVGAPIGTVWEPCNSVNTCN